MKQTSHSALAIVTAKLALGASLALGLTLSPHSVAHAAPTTQDSITFAELEPADGEDVYDREMIVNLSDLPNIDSMPVCHMEDGSDVPPELLPCIWTNDGNAWLTYEDRSYMIDDDTTHRDGIDPHAYDMGAYVGGFN